MGNWGASKTYTTRFGGIVGALVLSVSVVAAIATEARPLVPRAVTSMSLPVSSSVLATIFSNQERLMLLVLWRGERNWHTAGPRRESGGGRNGVLAASLQYGDVQLDLQFDPVTSQAVVQGKTISMTAGSNVVLVDGVHGSGPESVKALTLDAAGVNVSPLKGSLASLLSRSTDVVAFLRCDDSDRAFTRSPCHDLAKR